MLIPVSPHVNCYLLTPGRGVHALERVLLGAKALTLDEIAARATAGIGEYRTVKDLQTRLHTSRPGLYGPNTLDIDNWLDRGLTCNDTFLEGQITLFPATHARAVAADTIRPALFPEGVVAITRQPFVQQPVDVAHLLETYESPALAPARAALPELAPMMARVAELNQQYGESIDAYDRDRPSGEMLRGALERAHAFLTETLVLILAEYIRSAPERREQVGALLEPIVRQNDAVRAARRRRRPPLDIDPVTGIELPEEDVPAEQPA